MLVSLILAKKYIVTTTGDTHQMHVNMLHAFDFDTHKGYVADLNEGEAAKLALMDDVLSVEEDGIMRTMDVQTEEVPWGLARISHRKMGKSDYVYPSNAGEGVTVYIVDTGINAGHEEFEGRATAGQDFTEDEDGIDGNGHGSHCAGTIGGKTYGIAKKANLVGVKVLSKQGYGSTSGVIQGIEWAFKHHKSRGEGAKSVINMSLGGSKSIALNRAIEAANKAGVVVSVAAGNENQDACNVSPASSEYAITVGATTEHDQRAWFSNWGGCVDILAPGYKIKSAWIGSTTATNIISGTSMASPHVAGASAVYLSDNDEHLTPKAVRALLVKMSSKNILKGLPNDKKPDSKWPFPFPEAPNHGKEGITPNRLLFHPETKVVADSADMDDYDMPTPPQFKSQHHENKDPPTGHPPHRHPPHVHRKPHHDWWHHLIPHHWRHHKDHRKAVSALAYRPIPKKFLASFRIKLTGRMTAKEAMEKASDILKSLLSK